MRLLRLHFVQARNDKREISFRFAMTGGNFDQSFKKTELEMNHRGHRENETTDRYG